MKKHIKILEQKGWGEIKEINFGTLHIFFNIKNGLYEYKKWLVKVFMQDPNYNMIEGLSQYIGALGVCYYPL